MNALSPATHRRRATYRGEPVTVVRLISTPAASTRDAYGNRRPGITYELRLADGTPLYVTNPARGEIVIEPLPPAKVDPWPA